MQLMILGDQYEVDAAKPIGSGAFADVYRAHDISDDGNRAAQPVAIKVLRVLDDEEARARFQRELTIVQKLRHPNVMELLGYGEDENGRLWYAMPLAETSLLDELP